MSKREKKIGQITILAIMAGGLLVGLLTLNTAPVAEAHVVPVTCDFTTGGGFVYNDDGSKVNFGLVAGCKNGGFFGHVNVVNHDTTGMFAYDRHVRRAPRKQYPNHGVPGSLL